MQAHYLKKNNKSPQPSEMTSFFPGLLKHLMVNYVINSRLLFYQWNNGFLLNKQLWNCKNIDLEIHFGSLKIRPIGVLSDFAQVFFLSDEVWQNFWSIRWSALWTAHLSPQRKRKLFLTSTYSSLADYMTNSDLASEDFNKLF